MFKLYCLQCSSKNITQINTYKSIWYWCNDCNNATRKTKSKYFLDKLIFRPLILRMGLGQRLLPVTRILISNEVEFNYYKETILNTQKGLKWLNQVNEVINDFDSANILYKDKSILNLSGGPGLISKEFLNRGAKGVITTEFSNESVNGIKEVLGIDIVKFDYNNDDLYDLFKDKKFDVVTIIYSIYFCPNLDKFISELAQLCNKECKIYIEYPLPTFAIILNSQFDDYTFNFLYQPDYISKKFVEYGFKEINRDRMKDVKYGHFFNASIILKIVAYYYKVINFLYLNKNFNRELVQKNIRQIFIKH